MGKRFQSSPGPKAGCNMVRTSTLSMELIVSILTRPESRMQLGYKHIYRHPTTVSILTRPESRMQPFTISSHL